MAEDLDKPLLDPENFNREGIDLERIPLEEVFEQLRTSRGGLSSEDAEARLIIFGPNKLEEKPENKLLKFLSFMWNPLSWVMEAAAVMAIVLANGGGEGPDWQDFVGILCLLIINSTISFIEENNAGDAAAALMARLAPKTKVCLFNLCFQLRIITYVKMFIQECSKCSYPSLLCFYIVLECYPLSSKPHLSLAAQVHDAKKIPLLLFSDA
ncbi:hypothetical protein PVL29_011082 [Vitis rotundifolia]|uniref:Cation-transporting P-type ATPase N-terminal domain-containing protein n=1 Tax=Vitis rotundifolia TaxID=103349 RepID=A0AA38ZMY5_VITRO|nr:hypothetical protein PVL29_011082 [Vitis rotundifolia]